MNEVAAAHSLRPPPADADTHDLAISLAPALLDHCQGRLGSIEWFRASWQRGGSATGFSTWALDSGSSAQRIGVIVKFPVGPCELRWTTALGNTHLEHWHNPASLATPTPRVIASGHSLAGYDLAWLITERLQGPAPSSNLTDGSILDLLAAGARQPRFVQRASGRFSTQTPVRTDRLSAGSFGPLDGRCALPGAAVLGSRAAAARRQAPADAR